MRAILVWRREAVRSGWLNSYYVSSGTSWNYLAVNPGESAGMDPTLMEIGDSSLNKRLRKSYENIVDNIYKEKVAEEAAFEKSER